MKIGIETVYQSHNCGSFLQAYALKMALAKNNYYVSFVRNPKPRSHFLWYKLFQSLHFLCKLDFSRSKYILQLYLAFQRSKKELGKIKSSTRTLETIIYGSDTLWNIDDQYFLNNWKHFWGGDFFGRKIAYAISIGNTSIDTLSRKDYLVDCLNKFEYISVRDSATYDFVVHNLKNGKPTTRVVDPTMLLEKSDYDKVAARCVDENFIFVYYFGEISPEAKARIKDFSTKIGRKIISFGCDRGWADKYVTNDPFKMLSYFDKADFIITNTFHGSVFSIIYNKQFICFGKEKKKVFDLLEHFCLDDRLADCSEDFSYMFDKVIDYSHTNYIWEADRKASLEFLEKALNIEGNPE